MTYRRVLLLLLCLSPLLCAAADSSPREMLATLNALQLDSQNVYTVSAQDRVEIRIADAVISFQDGKIAFFQPFDGRITGFVFSGIGHVLALPRDPVERQQLARFVGAPVLDQQFLSAYVRFTDDTDQQLLQELRRAGVTAAPDERFGAMWQSGLARLNPSHSQRILIEKFTSKDRPFFHAGLDGAVTGPFDILVDQMRDEAVTLGQPRATGKTIFYDVWSSYALPGAAHIPPAFEALEYRIDTSIHNDNSLEGTASIDFRSSSVAQQILFVHLARALKIESITSESGEQLAFFQNEGLTQQEIDARGQDSLCVFLPKLPAPGMRFTLNFRYRGNVIEDAGNGVLYVGARESWYPHFGDTSSFALYKLTFHWPKHLRLVATGVKSNEREEGDFRAATWSPERRVAEAGFNLGEYVTTSVASESRSVDVYANRQLEEFLLARLSPMPLPSLPKRDVLAASGGGGDIPPPPPSPAALLKQLAKEIDSSIRFYEIYSGPFPFRSLGVSQIPGTFGQGWPGLLYLSTFSFLPQEAQSRVGLSADNRVFFTEVVPFHEVAHQWWGNVVGWSSYRDQWINEAIAGYLALMFADAQKNQEQSLHGWLDHYRKTLITKGEGEDRAPGDIGPLAIGMRLTSSRSPNAYGQLIYSKGCWILHMLREMLRQPNTKDPDARFIALLHKLSTKYAQSALTTDDLQREVEAVMTPKMDLEGGHSMEWFFAEYVRGTGIPHYKVESSTRRTEKGFVVRGKVLQSGVPRSFIAPVPLYATTTMGHNIYLGTVVATGEETSFSFSVPTETHKVLIDPHGTILCVPE